MACHLFHLNYGWGYQNIPGRDLGSSSKNIQSSPSVGVTPSANIRTPVMRREGRTKIENKINAMEIGDQRKHKHRNLIIVIVIPLEKSSCNVAVGGWFFANSFQILPINQALDSALDHIDIWHKASG